MILRNFNKSLIINISLTLLIFLIDRISKIYVIYLDNRLFGSEIFSSKYLNIILIWNEGIAFGLLSFNHENLYNLLTILIAAIILVICFMIYKSNGIKKYFLIFILGGALGNIYDRIFFNAVPDFIDFHINGFHWFVFNVADIFISLGVIFMISFELIDNNREKEL
tara:strand:- start:107 stop:604 length:498 start_codon:yes stop_codon:yes gene_type:complete